MHVAALNNMIDLLYKTSKFSDQTGSVFENNGARRNLTVSNIHDVTTNDVSYDKFIAILSLKTKQFKTIESLTFLSFWSKN